AEAGYYTVTLEDEQELAAGERFAVGVKITTPGAANPVAVEYHADEYTENVTTEGKESYLSQYGMSWENTQEKFETNVCLKVYTRDR
ncbi:MAG: lectin like domain-containing protein, partial [Lachnospiraceae bacterium]|nr:lectin like domain-containing protein [Lachnospiraceae bacterium]